MKILCIIPARGGSKRLPGKNILDFNGMPLIAWSVRVALNSGVFDEVMVSTDSEKIADVARRCGAQVPFMRSGKTSNDYATTAEVLAEVLECYEARGKHFDAICCLYATAPFVMPFRLREGRELLEKGHEAAFTVMQFSYPPQRALKITADSRVEMIMPEFASARSQDLQKIYHDAGQFYFCRTEALLRDGTLWGPDTAPVIIPEEEAQDIDTISDFNMALLKVRMLEFSDEFHADGFIFRNYTSLPRREKLRLLAERNQPELRKWMDSVGEISEKDHLAFIDSLKHRLDRVYYAVYMKDKSGKEKLVGSVNATLTAPRTAERGIWIAEGFRGKQLAVPMLGAFYAYLKRHRGVEHITTHVRVGNAASNALERALGASLLHTGAEYNNYDLHI